MGWGWQRSAARTRHILSLGAIGSASWIPWKSVSFPNGRKKALLIGINYGHDLTGPQKDVGRMKRILMDKYGYKEHDIVVLTDTPEIPPEFQPTQDNIMRELKSFLDGQQRGDQYFFMFAGHADQKESEDADSEEEDGMDERIVPVDGLSKDGSSVIDEKVIKDDVLKDCLVDPLFPDNRLIAIFDSCHSGTLLDLPHHRCNRVTSSLSRVRRAIRRGREICTFHNPYPFYTRDPANATQQGTSPKRKRKCSGYCPRIKRSNQYVLCISACKDSQILYESNGTSMCTIIMELLEYDSAPTLKKFMRQTGEALEVHGKQIEDQFAKYKRDQAAYARKMGKSSSPSPSPASSRIFQWQQRAKNDYVAKPQISSLYPLRMGEVLRP